MNTTDEESNQIYTWDWQNRLPLLNATNVKLGKGFLSCQPAKWVPNFVTEWLPLAHSLSIDIKISEITPVTAIPDGLDLGYAGVFDQEPFGLLFDRELVRLIINVVIAGSAPVSRDIILEYLARRFISTVRTTWVGSKADTIFFDRRIDPYSLDFKGGIKIVVTLNGQPGTLWIGLGNQTIAELDGMWRRQQQQQTFTNLNVQESIVNVYLEVAQLAVSPSEIITYTTSGTNIDLEIPLSRQIVVRSAEKPLFVGDMAQTDGRLCIVTTSNDPIQQKINQGMARLSICFGKLSIESSNLNEYKNIGSIWDTGLMASNKVFMYLNNEVIAEGILCIYEDRFALSVN